MTLSSIRQIFELAEDDVIGTFHDEIINYTAKRKQTDLKI